MRQGTSLLASELVGLTGSGSPVNSESSCRCDDISAPSNSNGKGKTAEQKNCAGKSQTDSAIFGPHDKGHSARYDGSERITGAAVTVGLVG